jgi:hypothetical protein
MYPFIPNGDLLKDLVEEHQRDILEEVEAFKLAQSTLPLPEYPESDYLPLTEGDHDLVKTRRRNRLIWWN